ncbi:hypothetical protein SAMN05443665_101160 [Actinomadura meyerae]|uniref:Uncharacterized protein n=1 Tax=Actinomadura meyerae TaxID=240840 RepID=A0A239I0Y8_9ACTN|nr:hypothetical protein [Actinomadura meyerae]SNS87131.1 hypothetical protein SAMN05443665_101160 [Actinomadura meyerae]
MTTPSSPDPQDADRPSRNEPDGSSAEQRPPRTTGKSSRRSGSLRSAGALRRELDQQVRDHYGTWRDQPRGLACAVIAAFMILTTVAFVFAVLAVVAAMR